MRILLLTQVSLCPADSGAKIKTLQVLGYLARHHEVVYCTFVRGQQEIKALDQLRPICQRILPILLKRSRLKDAIFFIKSLLKNEPFLLVRDEQARMRSEVRRLIQAENIDLLYVDQLNMMRFVPENWKGPLILDAHNALWRVIERLHSHTINPLLRLLLAREVPLLRRVEGSACRRAGMVLTVSEQDREALLEVAGNGMRCEVIPISVDAVRLSKCVRAPQYARLLSIGTLYWPPNSEGLLWWLRDGHALLRERCPEVLYDIVGARPPRALRKLAQQSRGVRLHGYVADPTPLWRDATLLAVPLLSGGGVRVKILEAMAMGVPVVSTTLGCEGLRVEHERHLLIADSAQDFAAACARLIEQSDLAQELAENAQRLILQYYDVDVALSRLDQLLTP